MTWFDKAVSPAMRALSYTRFPAWLAAFPVGRKKKIAKYASVVRSRYERPTFVDVWHPTGWPAVVDYVSAARTAFPDAVTQCLADGLELLICAPSGYGKSTLLEKIAFRSAMGVVDGNGHFGQRVPVFVDVRSSDALSSADGHPSAVLRNSWLPLCHAAGETWTAYTELSFVNLLWRTFDDGGLCILFDNYDRSPDHETVDKSIAALVHANHQLSERNIIVVASKPLPAGPYGATSKLLGFKRFEMAPLSEAEIQTFIGREIGKDIVRYVLESPVRRLAESPLTLTMLRDELQNVRSDEWYRLANVGSLYRQFLHTILQRHFDHDNRADDEMLLKRALRFLSDIADLLVTAEVDRLTPSQIESRLLDLEEKYRKADALLSVRQFVNTSILTDGAGRLPQFRLESYLRFFHAFKLEDTKLPEGDTPLLDPPQNESLLFLGGLFDKIEDVRELLNRASAKNDAALMAGIAAASKFREALLDETLDALVKSLGRDFYSLSTFEALRILKPRSTAYLRERYIQASASERRRIVYFLGLMNEPLAPEMIDDVSGADLHLAYHVIRAIGDAHQNNPAAAAIVEELLFSASDPVLIADGVRALEAMKKESDRDLAETRVNLIRQLDDEVYWRRAHAAGALGRLAHPAAVSALVGRLTKEIDLLKTDRVSVKVISALAEAICESLAREALGSERRINCIRWLLAAMPVASLDEMQFLLAAIAYLFMGESATGPASTIGARFNIGDRTRDRTPDVQWLLARLQTDSRLAADVASFEPKLRAADTAQAAAKQAVPS